MLYKQAQLYPDIQNPDIEANVNASIFGLFVRISKHASISGLLCFKIRIFILQFPDFFLDIRFFML